jgi:hypothetical protein
MHWHKRIPPANNIKITEIVIDQEYGVLIFGKATGGELDCLRIGVYAQELSAGRAVFQYGRGVSPAPERAVNVPSAGLDGERFNNFS